MFLWDSIVGAGKSILDAGATVGKTLGNLVSSGQSAVMGTIQAVGPGYGTYEYWQKQGKASVAPVSYDYKTVVGSTTKGDSSFLPTAASDFFGGFLKDAQAYLSNKVFGQSALPLDNKVVRPNVVVTAVPAGTSDPFQRFFQGLFGTTPMTPSESTIAPAAPNYLPIILFGGIAVLMIVLLMRRK